MCPNCCQTWLLTLAGKWLEPLVDPTTSLITGLYSVTQLNSDQSDHSRNKTSKTDLFSLVHRWALNPNNEYGEYDMK